MEWVANWIWDESGEQPRNHWARFRREFGLPAGCDDIKLYITADTNYTVYVNGHRVGSGPARGWPSAWHYDEYALHGLQEGHNVIVVLVQHYGMSTMQYIEGRGGLIAQLEFHQGGQLIDRVITDDGWKTAVHDGFIRETIKMGNCLPWSEIYAARPLDDRWMMPDFDASSWKASRNLGPCGIEPWGQIIPRDIPQLTDEPVYASRVLWLKEVRGVPQYISVDLKPSFFPHDKDNHAGKMLHGFLAAELHSPGSAEGALTLTYNAFCSVKHIFKLNGTEYKTTNGEPVQVKLNKGVNLLLVDVGGQYHEPFVHFCFDFAERIQITAPFGLDADFVTLGPFFAETYLQLGYPVERNVTSHPDYELLQGAGSHAELDAFRAWAKPVPAVQICRNQVSLPSVFKKVVEVHPLESQHQNMVLPNNSHTVIEEMERGDPELLIDFGSEWLGYIEFDLEAAEGTVFDFFCFESLHWDGTIEHNFTLNNALRYYAKGGRQTWRSFFPRGFRYVMLTVRNLKGSCRIHSLRVNVATYPTGNLGSFASSDYLLNRIWELSKQTVRMCAQDTVIDCPAYEQVLWTGDAYNVSLMNYYLFGNYELIKRCLKLISRSVYRSPLPESHVPSGWQNVLTAWSILWMMSCREYYRFTGDSVFLEEMYPELALTVERFSGFINEQGLLEIAAWNMLDWAPMDTAVEGVVTHQNALLVQALRDTAYMASELQKHDDMRRFQDMADSLNQAINLHLWDEDTEAFIDSIHKDGTRSKTRSIQTQLMVYLSGCVQDIRKSVLQNYLLHPPASFVQIKSPFVYFFYYKSMMMMGRVDEILESIRDVYGYMLEHDATTCWEGWALVDGHHTRSHCHAWSAAPAYVLGVSLLGVTPLKPGFAKVRIAPQLRGLKWLKGTVPTPHGVIQIYCKHEGEYVDLRIDIPNKLIAEVDAPAGARVLMNGKPYEVR